MRPTPLTFANKLCVRVAASLLGVMSVIPACAGDPAVGCAAARRAVLPGRGVYSIVVLNGVCMAGAAYICGWAAAS
jgi:hypothetical protein